MTIWRPAVALIALLALFAPILPAQPKKPDAKNRPRVILANPLGIPPGVRIRLTLRGLRLDTVTEVRFREPKVAAKILSKGKVGVPDQQNADRVGDSQVQVEVQLPADIPDDSAMFSVVTPAGVSEPHSLLIDRTPVILEKEPNDGFREAQAVAMNQTVAGNMGRGQDVDVFRFEGQAWQRLRVEIVAVSHGSALDPMLTLYDANRQILAVSDGPIAKTDPVIEATLPRAGTYYISVMDANDQGGLAHLYRLRLRGK